MLKRVNGVGRLSDDGDRDRDQGRGDIIARARTRRGGMQLTSSHDESVGVVFVVGGLMEKLVFTTWEW